ncbi:protein neprosin-like [Nicotiana tabacum]|uniref:protein neprosin-like n=1 Tax=Nicotiana tabacum TaxID=4097 RepID=UPI003F4F1FF6
MLMQRKVVLQILMVLYVLLSYDGVQGEIKLSKVEDLELEKQLKLLNKPATKIIKTKYGDIYDCVDFYKQPAFDHPLLKNHDFHPKMKPTLARTRQNSNTSATNWSSSIWLKERGCPFGTVPIKRVIKDDLIRHRSIPSPEAISYEVQFININNNTESKRSYISSQGYKLASAQVQNNTNNNFAGAEMTASLWNPHVEGQQHSACRLKIQKGSDILQVGWRVDPTLYKDNKTRLFVHFQAGNTHCFNALCPGFVLVNTELPVDMVFDEISHRGDQQMAEITMFIDRDLANGNWWLLIGENNEQVGFWPQAIFTDLASFATNVEMGGVAYSPPGVPEPPMGAGCSLAVDPRYDAYCRRPNVLNDKGETIPIVESMNVQVSDSNLYDVLDIPYFRSGKEHFVLYGGHGEVDTSC